MTYVEVHLGREGTIVVNPSEVKTMTKENYVREYINAIADLEIIYEEDRKFILYYDRDNYEVPKNELLPIMHAFDLCFGLQIRNEDCSRRQRIDVVEFSGDENDYHRGIEGARGYDIKKELEETYEDNFIWSWERLNEIKVSHEV
jgi:hypothetical protein